MRIHQPKDPVEEVRDLHAIALREHGSAGRSTRMLREQLERLDREAAVRGPARKSAGGEQRARPGRRESSPR